MGCGSNIGERLSAYLEDAVSREERVLIEEHLRSCKECSADLADLIKTVERIRGLQEVEPPAWMTQKIMTELREKARPRKGFFRRFFYPLYIKLPLQAVAALLVVGVALYIYRDFGPEKRFAMAPLGESASHILQRETLKEDKMGPSARHALKRVPPEVTTARGKLAQEPIPGKTQAGTNTKKAVPRTPEPGPPTLMRDDRQEAASIPSNERATFAGAPKKETRGEANQAAPELETTSVGKTGGLVLTVKVSELESASKEVAKTIIALGGRVAEMQSHEGRRVFVIDLNTSKFDELIGKLKRLGDVGEKGPAPKGQDENMRMRIETVEVESVSNEPDAPH
jgi:hypothetical protein